MSENKIIYSKEEEEQLITLYTDKKMSATDIAKKLNKPTKSVIAKLVKAKVYVPAAKPLSKRQSPSKKELLNSLEKIVGFDTTGFNGSTKQVLEDLLAYLKNAD